MNAIDNSRKTINFPHDTECERAVISCLLQSSIDFNDYRNQLSSECFLDPKCRDIFDAIVALEADQRNIDFLTVSNQLGKMHSSVSAVDVGEICYQGISLNDVHAHVQILRDLAARRELMNLSLRTMHACQDMATDIVAVRNEALDRIKSLFDYTESKITTLMEEGFNVLKRVESNLNRGPDDFYGTPTGFRKIDEKGGLMPSDLIVIGAETSQGKTSFALSLARSAIMHGHGVAFYSMEMQPVNLSARLMAMQCGISSSHILYDKLSDEQFEKVMGAFDGLDTSRFFFDGRSTSSLDSIVASIRHLKHKHDIKGAVVDYMQILSVNMRDRNPEQLMAEAARSLKNLAKELDIWIIAISQLSRDAKNPVPSKSRLRSSGQIEEAADDIYLIHRPAAGMNYPAPYHDVNTDGTALIMKVKGRNSGTMDFICGFESDTTSFYELDELDAYRQAPTERPASKLPF